MNAFPSENIKLWEIVYFIIALTKLLIKKHVSNVLWGAHSLPTIVWHDLPFTERRDVCVHGIQAAKANASAL